MWGWLGSGFVASLYEAWALKTKHETMTGAVRRTGRSATGRILLGVMWVWVTIHFTRAVRQNQKELHEQLSSTGRRT
jgi:hypothetical protein